MNQPMVFQLDNDVIMGVKGGGGCFPPLFLHIPEGDKHPAHKQTHKCVLLPL